MLNGCRVDVRRMELAPYAIDDEASKKSVSIVYYGNHNYIHSEKYTKHFPELHNRIVYFARKKLKRSPQMELYALGTGSAFTMNNWQSNFLIRKNGKCLLIDAGGDVRFPLGERGVSVADIDAVYISHLHADHIGGLEWLGFSTLFNPTLKKPTMFGEANLLRDLWNKSLVGGMEGLEGTKYTEEHGNGVLLSTYFDVHPVSTNSSFTWEGVRFDIIQSVHITCKYALSNSFGLMWTDPDTKERVYLTTDCQYSPEASMRAFYGEADFIFQDCETSPFKSGVHANYVDLVTLSPASKAKMWLYHYQDNVLADYDTWNAKAIADGFRGFVKTGASFARTYDKQEGGTLGNPMYVALCAAGRA